MSGSDATRAVDLELDQSFDIDETIAVPLSARSHPSERLVPCLGIVWHPDFSRIGDIAFLNTGERAVSELSRATPDFKNINSGTVCPLMDPRVSRKPLTIKGAGQGKFEITPPDSRMLVMVNGKLISGPIIAAFDELGSDIIITLSNSVILSIFMGPQEHSSAPSKAGMLGVGAQIQKTWHTIERAAATDFPILIRGETGTGKELAAQAVHAMSARTSETLVSINMATLSSELGAADLFGASKGAFTGAVRDRMGLFEQATKGSIFLDEIGDAPSSIQAMLLRILETGEYRRVGEEKQRKTGARVIAATDSGLEPNSFSQPLLRRLENITLTMAPLRNRRVDIGVIIVHFLSELGSLGKTQSLTPWIASLVLYSWPGNVRELRNVVQQMVMDQVPDVLVNKPSGAEVEQMHAAAEPLIPKATYRPKETVTEEETLKALNDTNWSIKDAAEALNISRTILYSLMEKFPSINRLEDITDENIRAVVAQTPNDLNLWAKELRVSREALRRRIKQLGLL